jgi:mono/diheme cytochrome c family protein
MRNQIFIATCLVVSSFTACKHESFVGPIDPNNPSDTVCFESEILPLFISSCTYSGCHNEASAEDGVVLISYSTIMNTGDVKPGNAKDSKIYEVLNEDGDDRMPQAPYDKLSDAQIALVKKWIDQGAMETTCEDAMCDTAMFTFSGSVLPTIETYCGACHSAGSLSGGRLISNYDEITEIANSGLLIERLRGLNGAAIMPQGNPLEECRIRVIEKWIENGSPND